MTHCVYIGVSNLPLVVLTLHCSWSNEVWIVVSLTSWKQNPKIVWLLPNRLITQSRLREEIFEKSIHNSIRSVDVNKAQHAPVKTCKRFLLTSIEKERETDWTKKNMEKKVRTIWLVSTKFSPFAGVHLKTKDKKINSQFHLSRKKKYIKSTNLPAP